MLTSIALIFLVGLLFASTARKLHLPGLLGMLITGMILGPNALNLIDSSILDISASLRQIALIIILLRAGLTLSVADLRKVGRPAFLMCFVPAGFEIIGMILVAPPLLGLSILEAALMGSVIAAVSPAVIVPHMIDLMERGYGLEKGVPQLIMAGASVDDVFVIVLFTSFTSLVQGDRVSVLKFAQIPAAIITGIIAGSVCGFILSVLFKNIHMRDSVKLIILLCFSFLMVSIEGMATNIIPFSGLLAVMVTGISLLKCYPVLARRISPKFTKLWVAAEVMLFVLVGAAVDVGYAAASGAKIILLILVVVFFRAAGVLMCMVKTSLKWKERLFCVIAYVPKATVQAAIGGLPLTMGLACGEMILTAAVMAILVTAPLGALGIELSYNKLLAKPQRQ